MLVKKIIRFCIYVVLIPFYTVLESVILYILFPFFRRGMYIDYMMRLWMRLILLTCGVKITVEGRENLESGKSYVFVANHQSLFDIPACFIAIPARLRMLAKKELFRIPVFGWSMFMVGHILINREDREKAVKSVNKAVERLKNEDISPVVFPEGTRSPDGKIHPFKKGAFVLALKAGRDIVPVTILGSREIMQKKSLIIMPGHIHVIIDKPIDSGGLALKDRAMLAKKTHDIIEKNFNAYDGKGNKSAESQENQSGEE